jgi:hypothetical protein
MTNTIYWPALDGSLKGQIVDLVQATTEPVVISCLRLDGTAYDLSAFTVTCKRKNVSTKAVASLTGTITPGNGTLTWTPTSADLGTGGKFEFMFTAVNGGTTNKSYPVAVTVIEDPAATVVPADADVGISATIASWLTTLYTFLTGAPSGNIPQFDGTDLADSGIAAGDVSAALGTGGTDNYVWTADGANGAAWEEAAGGVAQLDGGVANSIYSGIAAVDGGNA